MPECRVPFLQADVLLSMEACCASPAASGTNVEACSKAVLAMFIEDEGIEEKRSHREREGLMRRRARARAKMEAKAKEAAARAKVRAAKEEAKTKALAEAKAKAQAEAAAAIKAAEKEAETYFAEQHLKKGGVLSEAADTGAADNSMLDVAPVESSVTASPETKTPGASVDVPAVKEAQNDNDNHDDHEPGLDNNGEGFEEDDFEEEDFEEEDDDEQPTMAEQCLEDVVKSGSFRTLRRIFEEVRLQRFSLVGQQQLGLALQLVITYARRQLKRIAKAQKMRAARIHRYSLEHAAAAGKSIDCTVH